MASWLIKYEEEGEGRESWGFEVKDYALVFALDDYANGGSDDYAKKNVGPGDREIFEMDFGHFEIQGALGNKNEDFGGYSSELEEIFKSHRHLDVIKIMGVYEFTKEDRTLR